MTVGSVTRKCIGATSSGKKCRMENTPKVCSARAGEEDDSWTDNTAMNSGKVMTTDKNIGIKATISRQMRLLSEPSSGPHIELCSTKLSEDRQPELP